MNEKIRRFLDPPWEKQDEAPKRKRALALMQAGLRNSEIARELNVSYYVIQKWRRLCGVVRVPRRAPPHPAKAKALALLKENHFGTRVAAQLGVAYPLICAWAKEAGIPLMGRGHGPRCRHPMRDVAEDLIREGWSDSWVAERLGVSRQAVYRWRRQINWAQHVDALQSCRPRVLQIIKESGDVYRAAEETGVSTSTVRNWAKEEELEVGMEYLRMHAITMMHAQLDNQEIAAQLNVCPETVRKWRKDSGFPPLRRQYRRKADLAMPSLPERR